MSVSIVLTSTLVIVTVLQLLFAGYLLLLNPRSASNRTMAGLLGLLAAVSLATEFLQSSLTLQEATPWLLIRAAGIYMAGPAILLASTAVLRPQWLEKYRWGYLPVAVGLFLPVAVMFLDLSGASRQWFSAPLFYLLPDPTQTYLGAIPSFENPAGALQNVFLFLQLGFPLLALILPDLWVIGRERIHAPVNSRVAGAFVLATFTSLVVVAAPRAGLPLFADPSLSNLIVSLAFLLAFAYASFALSDFTQRTRQIQQTFKKWPVSAKLIATILIVNVTTVFAVGVTTLSVLRVSTIRTAGDNLELLAAAETRGISNELLLQTAKLENLAQENILVQALQQQNQQYAGQSEADIAQELRQKELEWQTASPETLENAFLMQYPATLNLLKEFREIFPEHIQIYLTDQRGTVVTGTTPPDRYNSAQTEGWKQVFAGGSGQVYVGSPRFQPQTSRYVVEIGVPARDEAGEVIGVLISQLNLQPILERISQIRVGQGGRAVLFNALGLRIPEQANQPPIQTGLDWDTLLALPQSWQVAPFLGQDQLIAWAQISEMTPESALEQTQWRILLHMTTREALAPTDLIRNTSLLILAGTVLFSIGLAVFLSRIVTYPLGELSSLAANLSKGNLSLRADVITEDEFGTLAKTFNAMAEQLQTLIADLEGQVNERTQALQRRAIQLQTAAEVGRAAVSLRDLDELLTQITHLISERFGYYHAGIFLLDEAKEFAVLRAANSPGGQRMLARNHRLKVGEVGIVGFAAGSRQPRIAFDVGQDAVYFNNPDLPETRSEMALPLIAGGETLGVLDVQSTEPAAFNQEDISALQIVADQIAIAIENARLFSQNQAALVEIQTALAAARRVYSDLARQGWQSLQQEAHTLAYRATPRGVAALDREVLPPPGEHPALTGQDTLTLPIKVQDHVAGLIRLRKPHPLTWSADELSLLEALASQVSLALESARLFQETQTALLRTEALYRVSRAAIAYENLPDLLQTVADTIAGALPAARVLIAHLDVPAQKVLNFTESNAPPPPVHPELFGQLMEGLTGWAVRERTYVLSPKGATDPRESEAASTYRKHSGAGSILVVPLLYQESILGTITAINTADQPDFTQKDADLLAAMAGQIAGAIENANLFQQTQEALNREMRERRVASLLAGAATRLGAGLREDELLQVMVQEIHDVVLPDQISLYRWVNERRAFRLEIRMTPGDPEDQYEPGQWIAPEDRADLWEVFHSGQPGYTHRPHPDSLIHEHYIVPWMAGTETDGVVELYHTARHVNIREQDQEAILGIVRQAAVALQSARLFEQTREALTRTEALYQVSQAAAAVENLPNLLQAVVDRIAESLPADKVLLLTLDMDTRQVTSFVESGLPTSALVPLAYEDLMQGLTGQVLRDLSPALLQKRQAAGAPDPDAISQRLEAGAGSLMVAPILYREQLLGVITAANELDHPDFTAEDLNLLMAMANQAAAAIENARLLNQTRRRALQLQTAAEVSHAASSILELDQLLVQIVELIRSRFDLYYVGIFLVDEARRYAVLRAGTGEAGRIQLERGHRLRLNTESMIGRCIVESQAQIAQEIGEETVFFRNPYLPDTRSEMALPLHARGQTIGAMTIQSTHPAAFSPDDITTLQTLADQLAIAIENARYVAQTRIRAENERLLNRIGAQLSRSLDLETIIQTAIQEIEQIAHVQEVSIQLGGQEPDAHPNGEEELQAEGSRA